MIELKGACGHPVHINEKYIVSVTSKNIYDLERTFVRTLKGDFFVCESVEEVLDIIHSQNICPVNNFKCKTGLED